MPELPQNVEQEIAELEKLLAKKRTELEVGGATTEAAHPKEVLREVLREKIAKTVTPTPIPQSGIQPPPSVKTEPPSYLSDELRPRVEELVKVAFAKSLEEAISLAKATENAALLDAFHDILVDELYSHLLEKGRIEAVT